MAVSDVVEKSWVRGVGAKGPLITLLFEVPAIGASHFVGCYLGDCTERKARRECRLAAREWAQRKVERHGRC